MSETAFHVPQSNLSLCFQNQWSSDENRKNISLTYRRGFGTTQSFPFTQLDIILHQSKCVNVFIKNVGKNLTENNQQKYLSYPYKYSIPTRVSPHASTFGPAQLLSHASRISLTCSGSYIPIPHFKSVPIIILTILYKKP